MADFSQQVARHAERPSPNEVRATILRYANAISSMDLDGLDSVFSVDAIMEDPVDGPLMKSRQEIRAFFAESFAAMKSIEFYVVGEIRVAGARAAAAIYVDISFLDGNDIRVETLDVFRFDDHGRITSLDAFWGASNVKPLRADQRR